MKQIPEVPPMGTKSQRHHFLRLGIRGQSYHSQQCMYGQYTQPLAKFTLQIDILLSRLAFDLQTNAVDSPAC